jgi:hypothetical protein
MEGERGKEASREEGQRLQQHKAGAHHHSRDATAELCYSLGPSQRCTLVHFLKPPGITWYDSGITLVSLPLFNAIIFLIHFLNISKKLPS